MPQSNQGPRIYLTDRQRKAWNSLAVSYDSELLYGGAKGGGKSYFGCLWCYAKCKEIIESCGITEKPAFPYPVGFMGRKIAKDFTDTTLETWKKVIPANLYEIKGKPAEIVIEDKVKILTGGLDRSEVINKFNSAEYFFFFIDQAEETTKDDVSTLRGSLRGKINDKNIPYKGLFTANPAQCWLKEEFILNPSRERVFVRALPIDNPHLPESYVNTLRKAFSYRPELLKAYLEGDWDALDAADQLIRMEWITRAASFDRIKYLPREKKRRLITCDPARFGDDETVIYILDETEIAGTEIFGQKDSAYVVNVLTAMSRRNHNIPVVIDACGMGAPISDWLRQNQVNVIEVNGASKPDDEEQFYNKRAEMYSVVARMFGENSIELHTKDEILIGQLCTPRFSFRNGRVLIEPKEDIKERLGRSPDRGDAYVQGVYALKYVGIHPDQDQADNNELIGVSVPDFIRG